MIPDIFVSCIFNESFPVVKTSNETAPNFAEELAKRLGTVRQAQKPVTMDEANESSINRFKGTWLTTKNL